MKESLLIFGGGELQISIINRAKTLGYNTVVIDPDPNALAKNIANVFLKVGGKDYDRTIQIAEEYKVKGLITSATDHPILMMCKIATNLGLPFASYDSCDTLLDKGKFKSFLSKNDFAHAKGKVCFSKENIEKDGLKFPVIVKPLRNSGSRGVIKCESLQTLDTAIEECLNFCVDKQFIIEEYLDGDEISVEAYVLENKVHIVQITDKIVSPPPYNVELGHSQPSKYLYRLDDIYAILQRIIDLTKLNNCALHPEFKIDKDQITIIEIGPRLGGDFITSKLVPLSTGIDIEEIQIKIATSASFSLSPIPKASVISFLSYPEGSLVVEEVSEKDLFVLFPGLIEFHCDLKSGMVVKQITNSLNRYGYFIIQKDDVESAINMQNEIKAYLSNKLFGTIIQI